MERAKRLSILVVLAGCLLAYGVAADDFISPSFIVRDPVMSVEGGRSTSTNFQLLTSTGQTVIGEAIGTLFQSRLGFLYFSTSTIRQAAFRFYANADAVQPTTALAGENTAITSIATNTVVRLRLGVRSQGEPFPKNSTFKLQFAELGAAVNCAAVPSGSFADVGNAGSAAIWRGYDNGSVADGTTIGAALLSTAATGSLETYEESNSSAASPAVIGVGLNADAEWDWVLQNNGAAASATYCFRQVFGSGATFNNYDVYPSISTPGATPPPAPGGGGGGGGGGFTSPTQVIFRGRAYPDSRVTILRDAVVGAEVPASPDASFDITLGNLSAGTYVFGVWSEDVRGARSITQTFTIDVTAGATVVVSGIFLPPTISIDRTVLPRGEPLTILGSSVPNADVNVFVNSEHELVKATAAGGDGLWRYVLDTLEVEEGNHETKARAKANEDISTFSRTLTFRVGDGPPPPTFLKGDLNKDGRVNLVDFSIGAYWYRRPLSGSIIPIEVERLNGDGVIDLVDFSIMAYYWTG